MSDKLSDEALAGLLAKALREQRDGYRMLARCSDVAALVREVQAARDAVLALLELGTLAGDEWHSRYCESKSATSCHDACSAVMAALAKAGVLP